ncbi:hypothetical protein [Thiocapsa sp.]|nr:hypothetical protein [Thiocapsa sp.]
MVFDPIHTQVLIDRYGGCLLFMPPLGFTTPFALPAGLATAAGERHE